MFKLIKGLFLAPNEFSMRKVIEINQLSNLPIDYVSLEPKDFTEYNYQVKDNKTFVLDLEEDGYINNKVKESIDLDEQNTVVINTGVGSGKSTTCINIALDYLNIKQKNGTNKYVIIFAAPYKSLITQYEIKLKKAGVTTDKIFNYNDLDTIPTGNSNYPIHLITINSLLGNYGEEALMQSKVKYNYLDGIINHCTQHKKKVIIFFDEIHDSSRSFEQKFIFNLWKWQGLIHKTFVLSATFSQASKVIIRYIADLTNSSIQLLEAKRIGVEDKQCNLHIIFNDNFEYDANDVTITELIEKELKKEKNIQILTFSKDLAKEIARGVYVKKRKIEDTATSKLFQKYNVNPNLCTSSSRNSFMPGLLNVGTNFKTGIDIKEVNTSFILIMPDRVSYSLGISNRTGIFSNGRNEIIQAIARMRIKEQSDIYIIMPSPDNLIEAPKDKNLPTENNYLEIIKDDEDLKSLYSENTLEHHYCKEQEKLVEGFYNLHNFRINSAIRKLKQLDLIDEHNNLKRDKKPRLQFPDLQEYILEDGDRFLSNSYDVFGKNCSNYIFWASMNNQFENARLKSITLAPTIYLNEDEIIDGLYKIYKEKMLIYDNSYEFKSEKELYEILEKTFLKIFRIYVNLYPSHKVRTVRLAEINKVEQLIISLVKYIKRNSKEFNLLIKDTSYNKLNDIYYDKKMYILSCIQTSTSYLVQYQNQLADDENNVINSYSKFYLLLLGYKQKAIFKTSKGKCIIPSKDVIISKNLFSNTYKKKCINAVKEIIRNDIFLRRAKYSFCQWADNYKIVELGRNEAKLDEAFGYVLDEFRGLFFETKISTTSPNTQYKNHFNDTLTFNSKVYLINEEYNIEEFEGINLIYKSNAVFLESYVLDDMYWQPITPDTKFIEL